MSDPADSKEPASAMFCRVSPDDLVLYCNSALAAYLGLEKDLLIGAPLESINQQLRGEMADFFSRQAVTGSLNRLIVDENGRIFEGSHSSDGIVLDLFLTEVTRAENVLEPFRSSIGYNQEDLSEEEIRSILHPERRIISLLRTRAVGLGDLAATLPPTEIRLILNTFDEEAREAILGSGGSVGDAEAGQIEGMLGIPRYYQDHSLRSLRAAFEQFDRIASIRKRLHRVGRQIPAIAAGIASGEVLISPLTCPGFSRLSASGPPSLLCEKLCRLARPGEILISQFALTNLLGNLPDGWSYVRAETEQSPDLSEVQWEGDEIQALPESLEHQVFLIGPDVEHHTEQTAFYFEYLYTVRCAGFDNPVPVLRVIRPEGTSLQIDLKEERLMQSHVAQVLGKYKLLEVIGIGGMGKVWKAQDRFGNTVAIKVLNTAEAASEESVRRFQREAEVMARLPHRNICRVFEIGQYEDIQFISMEFVDGLTLADLIYEGLEDTTGPMVERDARLPDLIKSLRVTRSVATSQGLQPIAETSRRPKHSRILPVAQTLSLFSKICDGVQFAHEHGILHRDLKPGNVLLREDGEPLVADFGLAKFEEDNESSLSISGHIVGTIENMSPEQAESSKDVDERADVYSLGTILYQMLTGHRHFESSGNILQDAQALKTHVPPRPKQLNPSLDSDLELICMKALRPLPMERYRTVAAMVADINRYRRGEVIKARPVTAMDILRKAINRHKAVASVIAVALLALVALAILAFYQINEERIAAEQHAERAEAQAVRAEEEARQAEMLRVEAEQLRQEAVRRQSEVETALADVRKMRLENLAELENRRKAEAESEEQRLAREQIESELEILRKAVADSNSEQAVEGPVDAPQVAMTPADTRKNRASNEAMETALRIFDRGINLRSIDSEDPEVLSAKILEGLHQSSTAILSFPSNPLPRLLKGHFHLALHEGREALESWTQARDTSPEGSALHERTRLLCQVLGEHLQISGEISPRELAAQLRVYPIPEMEKLASLVELPLPDREIHRMPSAGESILQFAGEHPELFQEAEITTTPSGTVARFANASAISDYKAIASLPLQGLHLVGAAQVDWEALAGMDLNELILENADPSSIPVRLPAGFDALRKVSLQGTPLEQGLRFLSGLRNLEELDLTGTELHDITTLHNSNLKILNLTGCRPNNLVTITRLSLQELILDPTTAANSLQTSILRRRTTPAILRTANDPPNQSLQEFFRRQDAGEYRLEE